MLKRISRLSLSCAYFFVRFPQRPLAGCIVVRLGVDPQLRHLSSVFQL